MSSYELPNFFRLNEWRETFGSEGLRLWHPAVHDDGQIEVALSSDGIVEIRCGPHSRGHVLVDFGNTYPSVLLSRGDLDVGISTRPLASEFVAPWLAGALLAGAQDHFVGATPFRDIYAIGRGCTARLNLTSRDISVEFQVAQSRSDDDREIHNCRNEEALKRRVRRSLLSNVRALVGEGSAIAECSGGFDSSIVCRAARDALNSRFRCGVFVSFDAWEFRREIEFARAAAAYSNFNLQVENGVDYEPWAFIDDGAPFIGAWLPSQQIASLGQAVAMSRVARKNAANIVLTGHGGDFVLATPLSIQAQTQPIRFQNSWISRPLEEAISAAEQPLRGVANNPGLVASGLLTDNPWLDLIIHRSEGVQYRSIFAEAKFAGTLQEVARVPNIREQCQVLTQRGVQRPLAQILFDDLLAPAVKQRRWKVNHVGLLYRSWARHGRTFEAMLRRHEDYWRAAGIEPSKLRAQIRAMRAGRGCEDRAVNSLVSLAYWLDAYADHFKTA